MADPDLPDLGSDLVVYAARLVRAVRRAVQQPAGLRVLSLLDEHDALSVTALAEADRCSQPTMSGAVRSLEEHGWVHRRPHPEDARSQLIELTAAGRDTLARLRRANGHVVAERLANHTSHSPEEVATAVAVLRDLLETEPSEVRKGNL